MICSMKFPHSLRSLVLLLSGGMGVGPQGEAGIVMSQKELEAPARGIAGHQLFRDCPVQCGVEGGVDAPDGLIEKALAVEFGTEEPSMLF